MEGSSVKQNVPVRVNSRVLMNAYETFMDTHVERWTGAIKLFCAVTHGPCLVYFLSVLSANALTR